MDISALFTKGSATTVDVQDIQADAAHPRFWQYGPANHAVSQNRPLPTLQRLQCHLPSLWKLLASMQPISDVYGSFSFHSRSVKALLPQSSAQGSSNRVKPEYNIHYDQNLSSFKMPVLVAKLDLSSLQRGFFFPTVNKVDMSHRVWIQGTAGWL